MRSILLAVILLTGCTDANWDSSIGKIGVAASIKCYSGGKLIFSGRSTGAVKSASGSDGWEFRDVKTNSFLSVGGDCILTYDD